MGYIELDHINKSFLADDHPSILKILLNKAKRITVLKDISLEVSAGEILGVIGKNGVGKSTLLRIIGGIYEKDSGRLITKGDIVSIFELGSFFNTEISGYRYCYDYLRFRGLNGSKLLNTIESIYEFCELEDYFYQPIKTYSSGMQARLLFGVATAIPARVILIDEFLVVGDEYFKGKAWDRLRQFLDSGATGIIVSHDWVSLMKLSQRAVLLSNKGVELVDETFKVVQKYLGIPWLESDELRFKDRESMLMNPVVIEQESAFEYSFQVEVLDKFDQEKFAVTFSIERYLAGLGWSLAIIGYSEIIVSNRKIIDLSIRLPNFCLAPGEYLLCIGLCVPLQPGQRSTEKAYEALTWLNGHAIKLIVNGNNPSRQLIRRKIKWTITK